MGSEILTVGSLLAGGLLSKDLVNKVLGPTAEYIGENVKNFVQKRTETIQKIILKAAEKSEYLEEAHAVPPRVLRDVLNEASFNDDPLSIEYFGGILASSKSGVDRDDRAATITGCLTRMSTYQIRMHYIMYSCVRMIFVGQKLNISDFNGRNRTKTYIPLEVTTVAMDFSSEEMVMLSDILLHCMFGLARENLIDTNFSFGPKEHMLSNGVENPSEGGGLVFSPSVLGSELFVRSHGLKGTNPNLLISSDVKLNLLSGVTIISGSKAVVPPTDNTVGFPSTIS